MNRHERSHDAARLRIGQFLGCVEGQVSPSVGLITETSYRPGTAIRWHSHQLAYLGVVVAGSCRERTESGEQDCAAGSVVFHPREMPHALQFGSSGGRYLNIELSPDWLQRVDIALPSESVSHYSQHSADPMLLRRLHDELALADGYTDLAVTSIVLEMLVAMMRETSCRLSRSTPRWLRRALAHLDSHAAPPSLEELAGECGVHPSHLARSFRRHQGITIGEYSRRARLRRVCRRLADTREPIARIAVAEGFADQSHLTRVMRRLLGITPAEYRRRC